MDKKKVIELIEQISNTLNWHITATTESDYNAKVKALEKLEEVKTELQKPTLDDYIQALPYLTFGEAYGEDALKVTDNDWAYAPSLYKFEGKWLIDWVEGEDNDSGKVIEGSTPLEAAKNAYNYCVDRGFIKDTLNHEKAKLLIKTTASPRQ